MKKILILTVAMLFVASMAFGWTVVGSKHDMRGYISGETTTQVCVFCHTPHQGAAANKQDPLWNHSVTTESTFGVYASSTFNGSASDIGGQAVGSQSSSALCMGCHDGSVAVNSLYKDPKDGTTGTAISVTGSALLGTDLTDDHPINFTYDSNLVNYDTAGSGGVVGLNDPTTLVGAKLIGGTVQCASCHNVHDNTYLPFLRSSNANSALCLVCHKK